ncbi:MAG: hypothetical protein AAGE03_04430 [Pseudomonadota bacterium]
MSPSPRGNRVRVLVVHHDMIVLQDLCETLNETAIEAVVDRAETLMPDHVVGRSYDAALIEVSRNAETLTRAQDHLAKSLKRVVWITDDMYAAPEGPAQHASLRQPFRTEDVTAALKAAGLLPLPPGN